MLTSRVLLLIQFTTPTTALTLELWLGFGKFVRLTNPICVTVIDDNDNDNNVNNSGDNNAADADEDYPRHHHDDDDNDNDNDDNNHGTTNNDDENEENDGYDNDDVDDDNDIVNEIDNNNNNNNKMTISATMTMTMTTTMIAIIFTTVMFIITLRPRQDVGHFPDDVFKCIFLNKNAWISIKISLRFVPKGQINNFPALIQIMACRRHSDNPLSEPMIVKLPTHICVTRLQWFKHMSEHIWPRHNLRIPMPRDITISFFTCT